MERFCDLHTHSLVSDGSDTPAEIVQNAAELGLGAVALTDHDTMAGVDEALATGRRLGLLVIPGVELSVESPSGPIHLLGYGVAIDPQSELCAMMDKIVNSRGDRNRLIVDRLRSFGYKISFDDVEAQAIGGDIIGRPHIAKAMVGKGIVHSLDAAFSGYLRAGGRAYVDRYRPTSALAIRLIHENGGVAVLAHPGFCKHISVTPVQLVDILRPDGIDGVECYYTYHTADLTKRLLERCKKYGLFPTGGSDYHGTTKPNVELGIGAGRLRVPMKIAEDLIAAIPEFMTRFAG